LQLKLFQPQPFIFQSVTNKSFLGRKSGRKEFA
jgi:hypothetical protein